MNLKAKIAELKKDIKRTAELFDCTPAEVKSAQLEYVVRYKYSSTLSILGGYIKVRNYLFPTNDLKAQESAEAVQKLLKAVGSK